MSTKKVQPFGPRVVGAKRFAELSKTHAEQKVTNVFGARVRGVRAPVKSAYSQAEVAALLKANPAELDRLLPIELARVEGPRKVVLRQFRSAELARKGGPRDRILDQVDAVLDPSAAAAKARAKAKADAEEAAAQATAPAPADDENEGDGDEDAEGSEPAPEEG